MLLYHYIQGSKPRKNEQGVETGWRAHGNARRVHIGDFMSRQVVEVIRARTTGGLTDALAVGIVDIASGAVEQVPIVPST